MKFSNCGQTCGQRRFLTSYRRVGKCCKPKCPKAFQVFRGLRLEPEPHAPKASALPTALHPVIKFSNCGQTCGQRRFLTNSFAEMVPASGSVPAGCGVGLFPSRMDGICSQSKRATNCATPGYEILEWTKPILSKITQGAHGEEYLSPCVPFYFTRFFL